jgi:hypothetical protein
MSRSFLQALLRVRHKFTAGSDAPRQRITWCCAQSTTRPSLSIVAVKFANLAIAAADLDADGRVDDVRVSLTGGQIDILNTARSAIDAGDFLF